MAMPANILYTKAKLIFLLIEFGNVLIQEITVVGIFGISFFP